MKNVPFITVDGLTFQYHSRTEPAIVDLSFKVFPGEVLLIAGSSGGGKTTLMRCINGLRPHTYRGEMSGAIELMGKPVRHFPWPTCHKPSAPAARSGTADRGQLCKK